MSKIVLRGGDSVKYESTLLVSIPISKRVREVRKKKIRKVYGISKL